MHNKKIILYSLAFLGFVDGIAFGVVLPILPELFLDDKFGLALANALMFVSRSTAYSICAAFFCIGCMVGMAILGNLSDKYGRRKILLFGSGGLVVCFIVCALCVFGHLFRLFILVRLFSGFFSGTSAVSTALVVDISQDAEDKVSNLKVPTLGCLLGVIVGPLLSSFIPSFNVERALITPFFIAAGLGLISFLMMFYVLPNPVSSDSLPNTSPQQETPLAEQELKFIIKSTLIKTFKDTLNVLRDHQTKFLSVLYFFLQFALAAYTQSFIIHLRLFYNFTPQKIGHCYVYFSGAMIISMFILHRLVRKKISGITQIKLSLFSLICLFIFQIVPVDFMIANISISHLQFILFLATFFYVITPFLSLNFTSLFSGSVNDDEQGKAMGAMGVLAAMAWAFSGLIIGPLIANHYSVILGISAVATIGCTIIFYSKVK